MWCAVKNCNNNNNNKKPCAISFFNFPSDPTLLKQWISFCCRNKKINTKTSKICMAHFKPEDFENNLQFEMGFTKRRFLKPGVVPTIRKVSSEDQDRHNGRAKRIQRRENKKIVKMLIEEHDRDIDSLNASAYQPSEQLMENEICLISSESEVLSDNFSENSYEENEMEFLKQKIEQLEKENSSLKETSKRQAAELKSLKEKIEKDSKIYDYNLADLRTQLSKANSDLNNLEENLLCIFTRDQIEKLKVVVKNEEDETLAITLYDIKKNKI